MRSAVGQTSNDITPPPRVLRKQRAAATRGGHGKTFIEYDLRLSIAMRYLAGGSYLDLMYLHGVGKSSVFHLLWDTLQRVDAALPEFTLELLLARRGCWHGGLHMTHRDKCCENARKHVLRKHWVDNSPFRG